MTHEQDPNALTWLLETFRLLKYYVTEITSTTLVGGAMWAAMRTGFFEAIGDRVAQHIPWKFVAKRKKLSGFQLGILTQKYKDLSKEVQQLKRNQKDMKKSVLECEKKRQNCFEDNTNLWREIRELQKKNAELQKLYLIDGQHQMGRG